ncbi:hypothetical protein GCK32_010176, partial [Trichostrongylus colubriformis]
SGNRDKARKALAAYHGVGVEDATLESEMRECEESLNKTKANAKAKEAKCPIESEHDSMTVIFMPWKAKDPSSQVIRQAAWLGVIVKVSTFVLYNLGKWSYDSALYGSFIISLLRIPFTLIPVFLVDRLGRRPLIISSTGISFLSLALMIVAIDIGASWKIATLVGLSCLLLTTACGIGSVSRFYAAELVPRNLLISSVSILTMFEALTKIGVEFAFYPIANI